MPDEPVEEVVAAEVDDVEADVSPEEFMARRKAALAKRKPTAPGGAPGAATGEATGGAAGGATGGAGGATGGATGGAE
jgi:uncharacterized membrane protein